MIRSEKQVDSVGIPPNHVQAMLKKRQLRTVLRKSGAHKKVVEQPPYR